MVYNWKGEKMTGVSIGGKVLSQAELRSIYQLQKARQMTTVARQLDLRRTFLESVAKNHPANVPPLPYDLSDAAAQVVRLDAKMLQTYKVEGYRKDFEKLAPKATAGLRENYDVLDFNNPNYMYNPVFLIMLVKAEAKFIQELHRTKAAALAKIDLTAKAREVEQILSPETISDVREIFGGRTVLQILELLRNRPLKIIDREVRPQTDHMLELEARIMAAEDITVITTEKFIDTSNIYLNSFLCFLLGSDSGTYYTPSHSAVYVLGRKLLAGDGAQLLPEVYTRFIEILNDIYNEGMADGHEVKISAKNDRNILNTLSYDNVARLFAQAIRPSVETIAEINKAAEGGLRIILNTLSGSAAKSLAAQFKAMGVSDKIFQPLWAEEDPFFKVGYVVAEKDGQYFVDHLGVDTTSPKVVQQIPYAEVLSEVKVGTLVYECDPDNDRFVVKQVLAEDAIALCESFGIDYYKLGNGKILAAPSPNKTFLMLDIADYERMKAAGKWEKYQILYFPTYVSSAAWVEFAKYLETNEGNIATFLSRVGFKNFNGVLSRIQDWWLNRPAEPTLTIKPQLGEPVTLTRAKPLRVLSKEEESGGRASGFPAPVSNILGQKIFSLPEKAVGDAIMAHLADMARRFNAGLEMKLPDVIKAAFDKYHLVSRVDSRLDILHGDQGIIAQVGPEEAKKLKNQAGAEKANFNNFFFSIARAIRDKKLDLEKSRSILKQVLPQWQSTWECLDSIVFVEEELTPGKFRPEGVIMTFSAKGEGSPLVTQFKFRPSGTDPLKSKVYIDAEVLGPDQLNEISETFNLLKRKNLYGVLDQNGIAYAEPKPAEVSEIGLGG